MLATCKTDIPYKGDRDYLHGTDIYDFVHDFVGAHVQFANLRRFQLKFHGFTRAQGTMFLTDHDHAGSSKPKRVPIQFLVETGDGRTLEGWHLPDGPPSDHRVAGHEALVVANSAIEGRRIRYIGGSDLPVIEAVVFTTKRLHQETLPHIRGKWVFSALDTSRFFEVADLDDLAIELRDVVQDRFTASAIQCCGISIGQILFHCIP